MSQEIIDVGASANDGQGDPIRTAFIKTNNNFTELFGIGASQIIYNGTSNVNIPFLNGNVFVSVGGVSNVMVVDSGGANIAGTLAVTGNVTGGNLRTAGAISSAGTITGANLVGDYISGIVTTASQTQITELGTLTSLSVSGNIQGGNLRTAGTVSATGAIVSTANVTGGNLRTAGLISVTGSVTAGNIFSNGLISAVGNITGANMLANGSMSITGDLTVNGNATLSGNILGDRIQNGTTSFDIQTQNGNANITVGGTSNIVVFANTGVYANGVVSTTGNVSGSYFIGNGSQLTGLPAIYGNADVVANLAALGSNPVSTTGNVSSGNLNVTANVTATYIIGNGSLLTNLPAGDYSNANVANYLPTYAGNLVSLTGPVTTTANITGGNILTGGLISITSTITSMANITGGNVLTAGLVSATGNVDAGNVLTAGQVTATGNITSGNILTAGIMSSTGNAIHGNILTGGLITATGNIRGGNVSVTGSVQTGITGNVFGGNLRTSGYASATGNIIGGNVLTGGSISATGNITTGNLNAVNLVINSISGDDSTIVSVQDGLQVYGDIIADNIGNIASINLDGNASTVLYGNGIFAPVAGGGYGDSNVTTLLSNLGSNTISATANITGNYFIGNGSLLTGIAASSYGNANVVANVAALGSNPVSTTGNITSGNVITGGLISATGNTNSGNLLTGGIVSATGNVTGNFFIGNGSALTGVTASANTGNVTFNNQVVVGTGDQVGSSGLYLAPGTESVANLQYWRVRGGDVATHMHLDTGNNAYFDQYFGDDGKYVKLANTGNVEIGSDDATGNSAQWTFGIDGVVSLPGGGFLGNIFGITALESAGAGAALLQNANCYAGTAPDESFTVVAASQAWTFSNANAAATLQCPVVTYAALPSATYAAGLRAFVNDSTVISFGDSVAGGAGNTVPVWSDGTVWRVG